MDNLPVYINIIFVITTCLTIFIFYKAANHSRFFLAVILIWIIAQSALALNGFYKVTNTFPPRFILLVAPPLVLIVVLFLTASGRKYIDSLNPRFLTVLHTIRIPVELVLFWLFLHKTVPQLMTFEGRNPDIISGITAPIMFYFGFIRKTISTKLLLFWNFICLALLINIVVIAIFSSPIQFQKFAFDQPNIAIIYFPFVWLPCCIVPIVLLAHLASIRQLLLSAQKTTGNKTIIASRG